MKIRYRWPPWWNLPASQRVDRGDVCSSCSGWCSGVLLALGSAILAMGSLAAEVTAPAGERILQQELKQQQIRTTTQRVGDQLGTIIAEFERNGIGGEDVKVLRAIRGVLGKLTDKDMEKVVQLLQQSRQSNDPSASTRTATDAYAGQKMIITQLNQLVLEYQRQQALYELSLRFKDFANRESTFMWQGAQLAKKTEGRQPNSFSEEQQNSLRLLQIDQEPIKDEVAPLIGKLEKLAREIKDGPAVERPKAALHQVKEGGLLASLDAAVEDLRASKLLSALGSQKHVRDQFREIARVLLLAQGELEALRQAIHELDQVIDQQKELTKQTAKIEKEDSKIEPKQAELVDATDLIRRDVDSIAPVAVENLKSAMDKMQAAREALTAEKDPRRQREKAPPRQDEAAASLEEARRALQEQLAKAEEKGNKPENTLAGVKDLQEQTRDLIKKQTSLKEETASVDNHDLISKAPQQGELKDKAQELQQLAASVVPSAAPSAGEAAKQMQKAQNSLANSQNNAPAQQAAIEALEKLDQLLTQEMAKLEQAQQELTALEDLLKKLTAIIEGQQEVQLSTAKEAAKPVSPPLSEISGKQETLGKAAGELRQEAEKPVPAAAAHLGDARKRMDEAKNDLDKAAPRLAQPRQTEALADLYAAKKEMESRMDQLRNMLGVDPKNQNQALADAASLIEQAQKDVSQAMSQMQRSNSDLPQGAQLMEKANKTVGPLAAGQAGALPSSAQAALQSAQTSLANGSAQASSGQGGPAQASAESAAQALAQAQAALALAQAGLNSDSAMASNAQGEGQGQGQGQGKGQGQGQGQAQGKGQGQGQGQGKGTPASQGNGQQGNWDGAGGADGPKKNSGGSGQFTGLPKRDRAAIQQSQAEKYPQEYGPLVEQYLKNLSDQRGK